jgi:hypothetical protein
VRGRWCAGKAGDDELQGLHHMLIFTSSAQKMPLPTTGHVGDWLERQEIWTRMHGPSTVRLVSIRVPSKAASRLIIDM